MDGPSQDGEIILRGADPASREGAWRLPATSKPRSAALTPAFADTGRELLVSLGRNRAGGGWLDSDARCRRCGRHEHPEQGSSGHGKQQSDSSGA